MTRPIIDFHAHYLPDTLGPEAILARMDAAGIERTVMLACPDHPRYTDVGLTGDNAHVAELVRAHPDRFVGGVYIDFSCPLGFEGMSLLERLQPSRIAWDRLLFGSDSAGGGYEKDTTRWLEIADSPFLNPHADAFFHDNAAALLELLRGWIGHPCECLGGICANLRHERIDREGNAPWRSGSHPPLPATSVNARAEANACT